MKQGLSLLLLVSLLGLASAASLQSAEAIVAQDVSNGAFGTPGAAVAVVRHGKIVALQFLGDADAANHQPVSRTTAYRIASITKMFTAVCVMQLVESGRLQLSDHLNRYLPWVPHAGQVTIEELLTHSSGIPDFWNLALSRRWTTRRVSPRQIVEAVSRKPLSFKPGSSSAYSNTDYTLLGLVVERISGMPLIAYERLHVFIPAKMYQTAEGHAASGTVLATPSGSDRTAFDPSWWYGSGDLVSTAADLARFDIALFDGALVEPATFKQMQRVGLEEYGHGLRLDPMRFSNRRLFGHPGGLPGYGAIDMFSPSDGNAIIALGGGDFDWAGVLVAVFTQFYPASLHERGDAKGVSPHDAMLFDNLIVGLQKGKVTRSVLSAGLNDALTAPEIQQISREFASFGIFQRLVFVKRDRDGSYEYDALFEHACYPLTFGFDDRGKLTLL